MPLGNPTSIVKQTILLYSFLRNLLMISPRHWFLGTAFLTAALSALIEPSSYMAIALLFFLLGSILFPIRNRLTNNYDSNWRVKGGILGGIVLLSLITICLMVPQVETNTAVFTSPIEHLKKSSSDLNFA
jgi:hypothetical protein